MVKQETCFLAVHRVSLYPKDKIIYDQLLKIYQQAGIQPPNQGGVLDRIKVDKNKGEELINLLLEEGKLVRLKDLLFHIDAVLRKN